MVYFIVGVIVILLPSGDYYKVIILPYTIVIVVFMLLSTLRYIESGRAVSATPFLAIKWLWDMIYGLIFGVILSLI